MIRQATVQDIPEILRIYNAARAFMRHSGNLTQWSGGYPPEEIIRADIEKNVLWGMENERGHLCAVFALVPGEDPSYAVIDGAWRDPSPYAAMHRAASDGTDAVRSPARRYARRQPPHAARISHERLCVLRYRACLGRYAPPCLRME